ncbi:MAG TPA: hypothetical protein VGF43_17925 [Dongiaceae bacterium]|jgi:hypothetical protein
MRRRRYAWIAGIAGALLAGSAMATQTTTPSALGGTFHIPDDPRAQITIYNDVMAKAYNERCQETDRTAFIAGLRLNHAREFGIDTATYEAFIDGLAQEVKGSWPSCDEAQHGVDVMLKIFQ